MAQPLFPQTSTQGSWRPPPPTFALNRMWEKGRGGPEVGSLSPSSPLSISLPGPVFQRGEHHAPLPCGPQLLCPCSDSFCHALGSPVSQAPRTPAFLGARSGAARALSAESATIPLPRTRAPSPDPLLRGVRKRSGLGHGPCAVTVPFPGQASNTPKWAPFFSGKSPRLWTEGTGLSRLLLRPRPGALCSGCGATGRRACSRALAVLLHQGLPQGTAGCLGARPCGPPVTAALSGPSCCSQGLRKHRPFLSYLLRPEGLQCCPPALLWARRWPATA